MSFGCHWINSFMSIHIHSRIFWCSNWGYSTIQVGDPTYLPPWGNVTYYFHGINLWNNLPIPQHFLYSISAKDCTNVSFLWPSIVFLHQIHLGVELSRWHARMECCLTRTLTFVAQKLFLVFPRQVVSHGKRFSMAGRPLKTFMLPRNDQIKIAVMAAKTFNPDILY